MGARLAGRLPYSTAQQVALAYCHYRKYGNTRVKNYQLLSLLKTKLAIGYSNDAEQIKSNSYLTVESKVVTICTTCINTQ
jgi:hypothetical protein